MRDPTADSSGSDAVRSERARPSKRTFRAKEQRYCRRVLRCIKVRSENGPVSPAACCVKVRAEAVRCVKGQRNSMHLLSHGTSRASSDLRGECAIAWNLRRECGARQPRTSTYLGQIRCCAMTGAIAASHVPTPRILQRYGQPPSMSLHHGSKAVRGINEKL